MKSFNKIYLLLICVPLALLIDYSLPAQHSLLFFTAALAIIPLASSISDATEGLSQYTGQAVGGMLNATFGNFPELIIMFIALQQGLQNMVLASFIGGILANLLLANGISFFVGGVKHHSQSYNQVTAKIYGSMMLIAIISMVVPSSFSNLFEEGTIVREEYILNIGLAITLLVLYALYLVFMLKTHRDYFRAIGEKKLNHDPSTNEESNVEKPKLGKLIIQLAISSVAAAFMAELLVGSAEATGLELGMSSTFIGIIVLAVVGGAAESLSALQMAKRNKMDLSLGITFESCIQIALFVAPLAVICSYFIGPSPLNLNFSSMELGVLFFGLLMAINVTGDGHSNWFKGIQLITVYLIIGIMFYFLPG